MLTRLRVSGFKNLVDLDVRFGPFTCIAGANGVGKSNLFDAIVFLSRLADLTLLESALGVRGVGSKNGDVRSLFHRTGDRYADEMLFTAELIVPKTARDDLGQVATATSTFVEYSVGLRYRHDESGRGLGGLELTHESLKRIPDNEVPTPLFFETSGLWRDRTILHTRRAPAYISTSGERILIHPDLSMAGAQTGPQTRLAREMPRTVLSRASASESPTATVVRREMQSWRLLQLEPSALRQPDEFHAPTELGGDGAHLPATLYSLATRNPLGPEGVFAEIATGLSRLNDDVRSVHVARDESRGLLTIYVKGRDGTDHPARALSDGTLRFLALEVLSMEPGAQGLLCLEEPENGIHPERLPSMIQLLRGLVTDPGVDEEESLRQVIINTHSPAVAMQVPEDSLLLAEPVAVTDGPRVFQALRLHCLSGTWRVTRGGATAVSKGKLLSYLNPIAIAEPPSIERTSRRVVDREDLLQYRLNFGEETR